MREEFVNYLWQFRLLPEGLKTTLGEPITVVHPGVRNHDAGPDFFNARIRIGETLWAGNVEVHLRTTDWVRHHHSGDKAYHNVILHVVFQHDGLVADSPANILELQPFVDMKLEARYERLMASRGTIPCEPDTRLAGTAAIEGMLTRVMASRMEIRYAEIKHLLTSTSMSWEEAFYQRLARSFGLRVNADAMEMLARNLPLNIVARHRDNLLQVEALLFGQAGLLNAIFTDDYPRLLQNEFVFLQRKYSLRPLDESLWRFHRLRPPSFPTLRIAQLAALLHQTDRIFSSLIEIDSAEKAKGLLMRPASEYWKNHLRFDHPSPPHNPAPGEDFCNLLLINAVVPFAFVYRREKGDESAGDQAINLLLQIESEKNQQMTYWKSQGLTLSSAFHSQALLELKRSYCDQKRCLDCQIGHALLKRN